MIYSQVGEWFNPAVSKTAVVQNYRVFESHPASLKNSVMSINIFLSISYLVIGLLCSYHWFKEEYEEEYNKIKDEEGET